MRSKVELGLYLRAVPLLLRNPIAIVPPLCVGVLHLLFGYVRGPLVDPLGGLMNGIIELCFTLLTGFAFGVSIVIAENAWRSGRASFARSWDDAKRKAGNILWATLGFIFILYVAGLIGGMIAGAIPAVSLLLQAVVLMFLIYTLPAAAIGGIPGFSAVNYSVEKVRADVPAAAVLTIVAIFLYFYVGTLLAPMVNLYAVQWGGAAQVLIQSIVLAYLAFASARQYDDVAFYRW
ncbi:MAG: hypothetical protein JOZ38_10240 [Candidatus Eremiobacteraeota bacterium]|nr:hypothetical protein [Candidatus Eremiobacteraeota bacterium]